MIKAKYIPKFNIGYDDIIVSDRGTEAAFAPPEAKDTGWGVFAESCECHPENQGGLVLFEQEANGEWRFYSLVEAIKTEEKEKTCIT